MWFLVFVIAKSDRSAAFLPLIYVCHLKKNCLQEAPQLQNNSQFDASKSIELQPSRYFNRGTIVERDEQSEQPLVFKLFAMLCYATLPARLIVF